MIRARSFASISNNPVFAVLVLLVLLALSFNSAEAQTTKYANGPNTGEIPTAGMPAFSLPQSPAM